MKRRSFLALAGSGVLIAATSRLAAQTIRHNPFLLGVASGSPSPDGFVLWTRLLSATGGEPLPAGPIEVRWELALDAGFHQIVRIGTALAQPAAAHSVHVEVAGLDALPDAAPHYWYRFRVADAISATGRTRTLPARGSQAALRLALASCQNWEHGYFSAYRHMAAEPLDCVLFVGDYIYEYGINQGRVRQHNSATCTTLDEYRARYSLYKSDPDLQLAHAAFPWLVTWDDHEVENDYADDRAASSRGARFLAKRAAAYQAYWEHMPLRQAQKPRGPNAQLYRRYAWGQTANLHLLDARQHRDYQVCTPPDQGGSRTMRLHDCPDRKDPRLTLLGEQQEAWLKAGLKRSQARFELVGQASMMAQMRMPAQRAPEPQVADRFWNDSWDGYPAARARLLAEWGAKKNVISMGGDVHASYASNLVSDFDNPTAPALATEFVGTSISSPSWSQAVTERVLSHNPHTKFGKSDRRGYTVLEVQGELARAHLRVIDDARQRETAVSTAASFVVAAGKPGAQVA